jgi:hypothetical protein
MTRIAFSGHRDRRVDEQEFVLIAQEYPGATWIHGGASRGFDAQVSEYAQLHGIREERWDPVYRRHRQGAPFVRTEEMLQTATLLVVCYDGRPKGGTAYAIHLARKRGKPVRFHIPLASF